jgi:hypothetical protein
LTSPQKGVDYELTYNGDKYGVSARTKSTADIVLTDDHIVVKVVGGSHHLELAGR